jgi:protein involved in polysaccharide export with SLBB domain
MPTRRITLFVWLAAQLWATAQVTHNGPSQPNFGTNSQSGPNAFQTPTGTITINGATGQVVPDPGATANVTNPAPGATLGSNTISGALVLAPTPATGAAVAPAATAPTVAAPVIPSGPNFSTVPLNSDPEQIDNKHTLEAGDQFIYQVVEDQDPPTLLLVDEKGQVNVPYLLEPIKAKGFTLRQVVQALQDRLTDQNLGPNETKLELYNKATIKVALFHSDQSRGHVTITGAVARNNLQVPVPNDHLLTLSNVIRAAGDFAPGADTKHVTIIHPTDDPDKPTKTIVDVADLISKGREPDMYVLSPGDAVTVPSLTETNGYVIVSGEIEHQPALRILLPANEPMTVSTAIIDAGWTDFSKHTVRVLRWEKDKDGKDQLHTYKVDVDAVLLRNQKDQDMVLQAGDVVNVDWSILANR